MKNLTIKVKDLDGRGFETLFIIPKEEVMQILSMTYRSEKKLSKAKLIIIRDDQEVQIIYDNNDSRNLLLDISYQNLSKKISAIIDNSTSDDEILVIK